MGYLTRGGPWAFGRIRRALRPLARTECEPRPGNDRTSNRTFDPPAQADTDDGPGCYWGLTQVTAHDETLLLRLLLTANTVLTGNSRAYALRLMAQVIFSQRWGVPAGAPRSVTVHVKNGWLPRATHGWRINSIGGFTWSKGWYSIVVLSMDNPNMSYGITTVEAIARVIHRGLNPTVKIVIAPSAPNPAWGKPDELIPALPAVP